MVDVLDQVRKLSAAMRHRDAEHLLLPALSLHPDHPDLTRELARIYAYTGREVQAVQLLAKTSDAEHLELLLARHFAARLDLDPKDREAKTLAMRLPTTDRVGTRLSATLITRNEEANLRCCLTSLAGIVDEVVVVDTGSTDETVAIAQEFGAIVGSFVWSDDFSAARNHAISLASGDWVLVIDADEELTPESGAAIRQAIVRPQFGGYDAEIVNFTSDDDATALYVHHACRLIQRGEEIGFSGRIHEQVTPSLERAGLPWANLPGFRILHHGYKPSAMVERNKISRTIQALEREVREEPSDPFHWFNLANAYVVARRWPEAENAARQCAVHAPADYEYGALDYQFLTTALANQGRYLEALKACDEADAHGYSGLFNEFERASILMKVGNLPKALEAATRCGEAEWPTNGVGDRSIFDHKRWVLKGQILALLGRFDDALGQFDRAHGHPTAVYSRAATLEKAGRIIESAECFAQGADESSIRTMCLKGAGRCFMTLGVPEKSAAFYRRAWESDQSDYESWCGWANACETWGDLPSIVAAYEAYATTCEPTAEILVNWGRALEISGDSERALACFTEAIRRSPENANAYFNAGDLLYRFGQYQDAAHLYQTGLRHRPDYAAGWFVLGNSLARLGIARGAQIGYERALVLDPTMDAARENLATVTDVA